MYGLYSFIKQDFLIPAIFFLIIAADVCLFVNVIYKNILFYKCINKKPKFRQLVIPLNSSKIGLLDGKSMRIAVRLNMAIRVFISFLFLTCILGYLMIEMIKQKV